MRESFLTLGRELSAFFVAAVFLVLMMALVYIDVNWMHNALRETSFTEVTQEILLALVAGLFFFHARQRPQQRGALILIGGFFSCMLIRELDFLFDAIKHGAWLWFALATGVLCLALAARHPKQTLLGLAQVVRHPSWQVLATGLLIVLVFSRLFGMSALWQGLMMDGYNRVAKNMAEEGCELLGYSFCLLASVRYFWQTRPQPLAATAREAATAASLSRRDASPSPQTR